MLRCSRTIVDVLIGMSHNECGQHVDMFHGTFFIDTSCWSTFCQFLSRNVDRQTAVCMYADRHWQHTPNFPMCFYTEFIFCARKLVFKKSVTLASHFTQRSTFNIEVRHILFITYLVAIKSYNKKAPRRIPPHLKITVPQGIKNINLFRYIKCFTSKVLL